MNNNPNLSRKRIKKAQEINQRICQWWKHREANTVSEEDLNQLIQELSSPPAVWYCLPPEVPYNSMESWCEAELGCEANDFIETVQSIVGEEAVSSLRDRRLSAIFRPLI